MNVLIEQNYLVRTNDYSNWAKFSSLCLVETTKQGDIWAYISHGTTLLKLFHNNIMGYPCIFPPPPSPLLATILALDQALFFFPGPISDSMGKLKTKIHLCKVGESWNVGWVRPPRAPQCDWAIEKWKAESYVNEVKDFGKSICFPNFPKKSLLLFFPGFPGFPEFSRIFSDFPGLIFSSKNEVWLLPKFSIKSDYCPVLVRCVLSSRLSTSLPARAISWHDRN